MAKGAMRAMYRRKTEKEIRCPLEYGLELFGGKWKSRIICVLAQKKTLRYGELRAELTDITDAVLSRSRNSLQAAWRCAAHTTRYRRASNIR